jgi:prepilin-type N-terminal cleavage/methylation domain-containing protein
MRGQDQISISRRRAVVSSGTHRFIPAETRPCRSLDRRGFTLAETLIAITIATVSGLAMLTSLGTAVRTASRATDAGVTQGLAAQLMDEVASVRFPDLINPPVVGPRRTFDDIDDFANYTSTPPVDGNGNAIGTEGTSSWGFYLPRPSTMRPDRSFLDTLTQEVQVERVVPVGTTSWNVVATFSEYRRVTVRIKATDDNNQISTLAELTRIFAHVPAVP